MTESVPVIAGVAFILLAVVLVAVFRGQPWAQDLLRRRGVRPRHADGRFRPSDFFRTAAWAVVVAGVLFGLSLASHQVAERFPNESSGNLVASAYFFCLFLFSGLSLLYGVQTALIGLWAAWRLRGSKIDPPTV